jgi:hypothetical protein
MLKRPVLMTLTMPGRWRDLVPDARALVAKREAFKEAWRRKYGCPLGVWIVEFQPRADAPLRERCAPHLHLFVGLPDSVSDNEYKYLQQRTFDRRERERHWGTFEARRMTEPIEGEFCDDVLRWWHKALGKPGGAHRQRGADIAAAYWSEDASKALTPASLGSYFWREAGKFGQKEAPEWFGGLRFWGVWGKSRGFDFVGGSRNVSDAVFFAMRRQYHRMVCEQSYRVWLRATADARRRGRPSWRYRKPGMPRGKDGLTVYLPDALEVAARMEAWAKSEVSTRWDDEGEIF